ncbi:MAG: FecR domain-containing protein [Opitutales bacterium]|nr:FecR domain-containing protein [Opitutales bacterium]
MIQHLHIWGVLCLIFVVSNTTPFSFAQKGSVIVIQTKGVVEAYSPQGRKLTAPVVRGSVLPVGYSIKTRLFAESTLLLSNGTTATLQENSKLRLDKFEQSPFDAKAGSFAQLQAEPSTSQVSIDIEIGSLVVQTKKLNKASSLTISTPVGTAVIRGTQFQMAMSPNTGMKLDVAESQVAFTPAGQAQAVVVGPGKGLDASSNGVVKQRPISPSAAQNINVKNSAANSICGAVPVVTAKQANAKATLSSSNDGSEEGSGDSDNEESSDEEGSESDAAESFIKQASNSQRQVSGQETNPEYLETVLGLLGDDSSKNTDIPASPPGFTPSTRPVSDFEIAQNPDNSESLDFIPISFLGTAIGTPIELSEDSTREDLYDLLDEWLPDQEFDWIKIPKLDADGKVSRDDNNNVEYLDTDGYFYSASIALEQFLDAPDYSLPVNESFRRAWFLTSLFFHDLTGATAISGNHILENANWDSIADGSITPGAVLNAGDLIEYYGSSPYLHNLGTALINAGALGDTNKDVALDILNLFNAQGTNSINLPNSFTLGVLDSNVLNSALLGATHEDLLDALDSPEKQRELAKIFKLYPKNLNAVLGADIQIGSADIATKINLGQWLQKATIFEGTATTNNNEPSNNKKVFAFAAGKDLHLAGDVTFENSVNGLINKTEDHALVLGSAQQTNIGHVEGSGALQPVITDVTDPSYDPYPTKINFEGSNLGIGSYEDLTLTNVSIDVGGNLALGTLSDMHITQTKFSVGRHSDRDNVYMYADELLQANDLTFSGRAREIYMEANTIDLRDVHFPGGSEVMLRSRDGIPNFYGPNTSNHNDSYKPFHVNFYSNSNSYGGQAIIEGEFIQKTHGVGGYNSQNFKTATGDAAIKIRAIPDPK